MTETNACTPAFLQMIKLATIGATGCKAEIENIDWPLVVRCAQEQAVLPLVACCLIVRHEIVCPEQLREQLLNTMRSKSGANYVCKMRIFQLLQEMEEAGIDVKLIKGYVVGLCYAYSDCRISTDTDLLISEEQEKQVCDFLREKGFRVDPRGETSHHAVCQHPKLGMVEAHVHLYAEIIQSVWFKDTKRKKLVLDKPVRIQDGENRYNSLGYTDHLIFMTLHMIKHFIHDGLGLRMMLDIALFFKKHSKSIDAERYWSLLEELHYSKVVHGILWVLIDTGCFSVEDFPKLQAVDAEAITLLLHDLELGGHMGIKQGKENRIDGYYEYSRQVILREKSPLQYRLYMIRYKIRSARKQMLPVREQLTKLYPATESRRWLTPFVRIHRMFAYPIRKVHEGVLKNQIRTDATEMHEEAKRRVEMFKKLGMI